MISFIVPAYNAEKTLERAIKSIINQKDNKFDYEIIIVNDGSTDKTKEVAKQIIEQYSKTNNNIYYIEQENGGPSKARNTGTENSKGDYIIFVDSDDYISDTLLKDIEEHINKGIELIKWNPIFVTEDGQEVGREPCYPFDVMTGIEAFNYLYGRDKIISTPCTYAIKRTIAPIFPEGRYHEDFAVMPFIILKAKTMVFIDKNEYYYVQTNNSIMRNADLKKQRKKLEDLLYISEEMVKQSEEFKLDKYTQENLSIFITNSLLAVLSDLSGENKKYYESELKKRKISKNIKIRNPKQLAKKILLKIKGF